MEIKISKLREDFKGKHHLLTTSDNIVLFLRAWEPRKKTDKAILILHGITAHSGPYEPMAKPLSTLGFSVFGLDLRGHGLSDGNRGDYPSRKRLIKDLCETISFLKQKFSILILLGHSLGVASSLIAATHCPGDIDGLILLSAGTEIKPGVYPTLSAKEKLRILFYSIFFPGKPVISYERNGMVGLDDPLFNFNITLRFLRAFNPKKIKIDKISNTNLPLFVGIGEHDEIFSVESAQKLFDEIPSDNKKFFVIPGGKHADFPEESFQPLVGWLKENF
ncbi:MAG: alpha/beta hydrolase [Candidatus Methanofastidiosia archaeon]